MHKDCIKQSFFSCVPPDNQRKVLQSLGECGKINYVCVSITKEML